MFDPFYNLKYWMTHWERANVHPNTSHKGGGHKIHTARCNATPALSTVAWINTSQSSAQTKIEHYELSKVAFTVLGCRFYSYLVHMISFLLNIYCLLMQYCQTVCLLIRLTDAVLLVPDIRFEVELELIQQLSLILVTAAEKTIIGHQKYGGRKLCMLTKHYG